MVDVTVVATFHNEGRLATAALRSAAAAVAAAPDVACEILAVVDRGDAATERALKAFDGPLRVETCAFGDPALARNHGVGHAQGAFVAFLDGDDLMGRSWLRLAAAALRARAGREVVAHPRVNYLFAHDAAPTAWLHPDMETDPLDLALLRAANFWTSASFARAELHRRFPFPANALERGLGHEDWAFNLAVTEAGVTHIAPEGTVHFIRRRNAGRLAASLKTLWLPNFQISPATAGFSDSP